MKASCGGAGGKGGSSVALGYGGAPFGKGEKSRLAWRTKARTKARLGLLEGGLEEAGDPGSG